MSKSPFNIQDQYLNQSRKERVRVAIHLLNDQKLDGYIKSFDSFSILMEINGGDVLLYKHAIARITSADGSFRLHQ